MQRTWTLEQLKLLRENYPVENNDELIKLFPDKTEKAIISKARVLKLKKIKKRFYFSEVQLKELKELYPTTLSEDLAKRFGCNISSIYNKANLLGLKKDSVFISEISTKNFSDPNHPAKKFWIKKGQIPANKGKKQSEFMSEEAIEKTKATRFKPGQKTWNNKPIGYERINSEGYVEIKVSEPRKFQPKHRYTWEKYFGPIPKGYNVQFKDRNPLNCNDPNNLYIISRADQMRNENSFIAKYPKDIQLAIQARGALSRQINIILNSNEK